MPLIASDCSWRRNLIASDCSSDCSSRRAGRAPPGRLPPDGHRLLASWLIARRVRCELLERASEEKRREDPHEPMPSTPPDRGSYTPPEAKWVDGEWQHAPAPPAKVEASKPPTTAPRAAVGSRGGYASPAAAKAAAAAAAAAKAAEATEAPDYRLREWWPIRRLRPLPPPTPATFGAKLQVSSPRACMSSHEPP